MSPQSVSEYQPTWDSLAQHPIPKWLLDAKFGIYAHWGVYSVPAFDNEWYAKRMYDPSHPVYQHHIETYGPQDQFGYKDFVPEFTAHDFDPDEWAEVIARSGARYAGIALVHHDGFCLWNSAHTRWNVSRMGPKRDLYGELVTAIRKQQLKTIATFHHIRTFNWYLPDDAEAREAGRQAGWDLFDPQYADLYWNEYTGKRDDFVVEWRNKVNEVMDVYQPDVIWFDGGSFQDEVSSQPVRELLAAYYNREQRWGKQVEILNKLPTTMKWNFGPDIGMLTYEQGRDRPALVHRPWTDDMPIGSRWGYVKGMTYRDPGEIVHGLIDRTSRNGGLILSLSPKADGTLPKEQKEILHKVGSWLNVNGEAIYGTRPWTVHDEGPQEKFIAPPNARGHRPWIYQGGDAGDIRYTQKDRAVYALVLGWPEDDWIKLRALGSPARENAGEITDVTLLGHAAPLNWQQGEDGLTVAMPPSRPCEYAYAFRITVHK